MKNLFDEAVVGETLSRMERLTPTSERVWGKMNAAQAMAHCCVAMEMAVGDQRPKRLMIGRLLGPVFKGSALSEKPNPRNTPTDPSFVVTDERNLSVERVRLEGLIRRFCAGGAAGCTDHPHSFFGPMTPEQWARQQWSIWIIICGSLGCRVL